LTGMEEQEWFHLRQGLFSTSSFEPTVVIEKLFGVKVEAQKSVLETVKRNTTVPLQNIPLPPDDEDYDLDELLSDRLVEDDGPSLDETELGIPQVDVRGNWKIAYLDGYSVYTCRQAEKRAQDILDSFCNPVNKLTSNQQKQKFELLRQEILVAKNKRKFLQLVMDLQKKGLLQLPDVTDFLKLHSTKPIAGRILSRMEVRCLSTPTKWSIYFAVAEKARAIAVNMKKELDKELESAYKTLEAIRRHGDGQILRKTKVVGMTTTGAAKNHDLLKMMKSKIGVTYVNYKISFFKIILMSPFIILAFCIHRFLIVIVEEAAEVLEAHIVTCITEYCQQLILIGEFYFYLFK